MGDGVIDIQKIHEWMEAQGYDGFGEGEIFSNWNWWQLDAETTLDVCIDRHHNQD